jgi:hypothetical protein
MWEKSTTTAEQLPRTMDIRGRGAGALVRTLSQTQEKANGERERKKSSCDWVGDFATMIARRLGQVNICNQGQVNAF